MEAAETLARQLQLPELVATVASYLDGSDSNAVDPCLRAERDFTMALFLFTGNVRIVVYYTRLQYMPRYDYRKCIEHLCLVNGLLHSLGNEPARITVGFIPGVSRYWLEWKDYGRDCLNYPSKFTAVKVGDLDDHYLLDTAGNCALHAVNRERRIWHASHGYNVHDRDLTCQSQVPTPCERDCAVCPAPLFEFLQRFANVDTQMVVDKCADVVDFKWFAQFCVPRNYYATDKWSIGEVRF